MRIKNMTNEEKQILLNDLCARLPYNPKVKYAHFHKNGDDMDIVLNIHNVHKLLVGMGIYHIKPYLRSMETMTEEEKSEIRRYFIDCEKALKETDWDKRFIAGLCQDAVNFDYLNSRHFDYRGLIEMGLALPAPEEMYKLNQ